MSSGWGVYYAVCLAAILALSVPLLLKGMSLLIRLRNQSRFKPSTKKRAFLFEPDSVSEKPRSKKLNPRFYLAINVSILLISLSLALIPPAGALRTLDLSGREELFVRGLIVIVSISSFLSLGLLYAVRKGDLSWSRFFHE